MEKTTETATLDAPKTTGGGGGGGEVKVKRDEWSEGGVSRLLEAYEAKWVSRNRAKLKGQDWDEVARFVSSTTESVKTQTQCKNKIESMKKRYRSESSSASTWPLYDRIHLLLRRDQAQPEPLEIQPNGIVQFPIKEEDRPKLSHSDRAQARPDKTKVTDDDTTNSTSATPKLRPSSSNTRKKKKSKSDIVLVAESVKWVAEAVVKMEKERMEAMRDLERMRADAEIRRGELELKRIRIIADTQVEIARLFSGRGSGRGAGAHKSTAPFHSEEK